jgi:diguanylate cyclase (GGDEF)-like protein
VARTDVPATEDQGDDTAPTTGHAEDCAVADESLSTALQLLTAPAAATFPLLLTAVLFLANEHRRDRLVPWIVAVAAATAFVALAMVFAREMRSSQQLSRAAGPLVVASLLVGGIWGSTTFLIDFDATSTTVALLLFPIGASIGSIIIFAPSPTMFLAFQTMLVTTASVGLMLEPRPESASIAIINTGWFVASHVLHRVVHRYFDQAVRLRVRTDHLVARLSEERSHLAELNSLLLHQATHDPLTDLANRRGTLDALAAMLQTRRDDELLGLVYLDLDHFKQVNDSYGHEAGDALLKVTADRIRRVLPDGAVAGRIGGDEIVVMLPKLMDQAEAVALADHLARAVGEPLHVKGRELVTSISVGLALAPLHATTEDALMRYANAALHRAKADGRSRVVLFDGGIRSEIDSRDGAEFELRRALDNGEIVPFLQPEIDAASGRVVGAEILARWLRRDGTVLNAITFVPTARDLGLLEYLQRTVMAQISPIIRRLNALGLPQAFRFRMNLPGDSRARLGDASGWTSLFQGVPPSLLTVDVTERVVHDHLREAAAALESLRSLGVRIGLDDFGRGGSSIMLLRRLPLDEVRIDYRLLDGVSNRTADQATDRAILRSIVTLVHDLGLEISADGVESPTQADTLLALGCNRQQGHLYAPALPPAAFERFLVDSEVALSHPSSQNWSTDELM